jgi:hypothetical protein
MINRVLFLLLVFFLVTACDDTQRRLNMINGEWEGTVLLEEGDSLPVNPKMLGFTFDQDQKTYTFRSTLNYQEAGTFYIQTKYLFTKDSLNQEQTEKGVEILQITTDSLYLKMEDNGKERIMKLRKVE